MTRLRMIVGWREVESSMTRMMKMALAPVTVAMGEDESEHFWCAADKPEWTGADFAIKPVYRTHRIPEDARCEVCDIPLRELQVELTNALKVRPSSDEGSTVW